MTVPVAWVVGLMTALEPAAPWRTTFERTATAIAHVAEEEPLFQEADPAAAEQKTAALLVAMAWHESRLKPTAKSRNGKWYCLYQIDKRHFADPQKALDDPEFCTRKAVQILRTSLKQCASSPMDERLAQFMSGTCRKARLQSRYRMFLTRKLLREHPCPPSEHGEPNEPASKPAPAEAAQAMQPTARRKTAIQ